jgi:hypothetical protein
LLSFTRTGVKIELDRFFKFLCHNKESIISYSPSAFSQARNKLHEDAFIYIKNKHLDYFQKKATLKAYWRNYRVVAIDGSSLNLPKDPALIKYFGITKNQNKEISTGAKISVAYDVCNNLILDALIDKVDASEQSLAIEHMHKLNAQTDLLVFDRGYPGIAFVLKLMDQGFKFCFRLSSSWKEAYQLLEDNNHDIDWTLRKGRRYRISNGKEQYLTEDLFGLRLVKIILPNGQVEVLLTNLSDRNTFDIDSLKELYKMRWSVEECYKRLKQVGQIEYFTGRTVRAVKQDFNARIVMLNMASMIESQCVEPEIANKLAQGKSKRKHKVQVNRTQIWAKMKDFLYEIFWDRNRHSSIKKMLSLMYNCFDIIREGRSFKRTKDYRCRRKPLLYKGF